MKLFKFTTLVAIWAIALLTFACSGNNTETTEIEEIEEIEEVSPTVVEIAVSSADHTTLVAAVSAADLVEVLNGEGPFTIFAPTNAAFSALPDGTVESLLLEENKDSLTGVLTYHVVAGNVLSGDLSDGMIVTTIQGQDLTVSIENGTVKVNGATVIAADLVGSNGVIHVIDAVLLPSN